MKCACSTYLICGNDKTQKQIDNDFKIWKKEKLKSVTHLVELENASAVANTHNGEPNDPTLSKDITENVAKSHDRHIEDDYNTDIGSSLWESKDDMDEIGMKHVSRHGHKHQAKLRKSKNDIDENGMKHISRHGYSHEAKLRKSKNYIDENGISHVSRHGHKHEAKLRKSKHDIKENTRKHTFRHDNDQTYDTNKESRQNSQSATDDVSSRDDSNILANKHKGICVIHL